MNLCGALMVCGTTSGAGKSRLVAGLCRVLSRRSVHVAPFKAQNMSLNAFVTREGHEIARAQAFQAVAARIEPVVAMNPVLLKPVSGVASQVIVEGKPLCDSDARSYETLKDELFPRVLSSLATLRADYAAVILEGAGGAAEINLFEHDIVNLRLADAAGVPAIVVGDIEPGGVFAGIYGTVALLPQNLRACLGGFVINKFRGDPDLLRPGIHELESRTGLSCLGVLPYLDGLGLDAEDGLDPLGGVILPDRLGSELAGQSSEGSGDLDVVVIGLPHMANTSDFDPLLLEAGVQLRFVTTAARLGNPDLIILPGSKATVADLTWMANRRFDEAIARAHKRGSALLGICAGYQMLGEHILDDVESRLGAVAGLGYLPVTTTFSPTKCCRQRSGRAFGGIVVDGYEIRHGTPVPDPSYRAWFDTNEGPEGLCDERVGLFATSWHGLFESDHFRAEFCSMLAYRSNKDFVPTGLSFRDAREHVIDTIADALEERLDLDATFALLKRATTR